MFSDMLRARSSTDFFVGPLLQQLAQPQQEHDRARGAKILPEHGNAHGNAVQHLTWSCRRSRQRAARYI